MTAFFDLGQFIYVNVLILSDHKTRVLEKLSIWKAKEEQLWKLKYISPMQKYYIIFFKKINPLKRNQNPSRYYHYNTL